MKDYVANIIEQMGYHVVNPNQKEITIINKSTREALDKRKYDNYTYFIINDEEAVIEKISIRKNGNINIETENLDIETNTEDEDATYYVMLSNYDGIKLEIMVRQFFDRNLTDCVADIGVYVIESQTDGSLGDLDIYQYSNYCKIEDDKNEQEIPASECKVSNIMKTIMDYLSTFEVVEKSKSLQEGLKYIVPSLKIAVGNMLDYWKDYAVPVEINHREQIIESLKKQIEELNSTINSHVNAINELNGTLNSVNKGTRKK